MKTGMFGTMPVRRNTRHDRKRGPRPLRDIRAQRYIETMSPTMLAGRNADPGAR